MVLQGKFSVPAYANRTNEVAEKKYCVLTIPPRTLASFLNLKLIENNTKIKTNKCCYFLILNKQKCVIALGSLLTSGVSCLISGKMIHYQS